MSAGGPFRRGVLITASSLLVHLLSTTGAHAQAGPDHSMGGMNMDRVIRTFILAEQLELQPTSAERPFTAEILSWIGGDYRRLYVRVEGEQSTLRRGDGRLQADALYGRLVTPFWSAVGGVRLDTRPQPGRSALAGVARRPGHEASIGRLTRGLLAVGMVGIAPGWFELEPTLFVSDAGHVSFELESSFDLLLTQRLIVQPRVELNAALQAVPRIGIGSGFNDFEIGARMRYEVRRKFAPYVGVSWHRLTGATAAMAQNAGEPRGTSTVSAGVRIWR